MDILSQLVIAGAIAAILGFAAGLIVGVTVTKQLLGGSDDSQDQ